MHKTIIFDMGETLVHNIGMDFTKSLEYLFESSKHCNVKKDVFIENGMKILNDIFNERKELEFKMIEYIKLLIDFYELVYDKTIEELEEDFAFKSCKIEFVENSLQILQYFKNKNYQLILLSNTSFSRNVVVKMLDKMVDFFEHIIVSSETVFRKPNKYIFELGIKFSKNSIENIYYIGNDYYYDVFGSSNSNINSIWFNEKKLEKNNKYNVKKYIEIRDFVELINMNF